MKFNLNKIYIHLYIFITYNAQYMAYIENIINLEITREWKDSFPGASVGVLVMRNTVNPKNNPDLDKIMKYCEQANYWSKLAFVLPMDLPLFAYCTYIIV